jgi:hypothetical protein
MYALRNIEARSHKHWCRQRVISIIHSEFVSVPLVTQNAIRMRRIMLFIACPDVPSFYTPYHKRQDFRAETILNKKCWL